MLHQMKTTVAIPHQTTRHPMRTLRVMEAEIDMTPAQMWPVPRLTAQPPPIFPRGNVVQSALGDPGLPVDDQD